LNLENVEKHLIGHLQTNKVKKIVGEVDMIQSVDSLKVAHSISNEAQKSDIIANVLLEINIGDEDSKTGFDKVAFEESLTQISLLPNLKVKGLMTIPPICENTLELEKYFDKMSNYYNEIKAGKYNNFDFEILSMGMSGDYKEAILHGSNLVRVGSAIFGARIYK
jgi:pyridoxal phosphate enzyme (YggS family)